jgi:hypothetical protein
MVNATKDQGKVGRGKHPNSRKNLEKGAWAKGQSGNPDGKPVGTSDFKTRFEKKLFALAPDKVQLAKGISDFCAGINASDITNADALDAILIYKAVVERDMPAIKEVLDRTEGKAMQRSEITGKDGNPIEHKVFKVELTDD